MRLFGSSGSKSLNDSYSGLDKLLLSLHVYAYQTNCKGSLVPAVPDNEDGACQREFL